MAISSMGLRALQAGGTGTKGAIRYPGLLTLWAGWSVIGALTYARNYLQFNRSSGEVRIIPDLLSCMACYYPWVVLAPLVFRLERHYPLGAARWLRNLAWLALWSIPMSLLASPLMLGLNAGVRMALGSPVWIPGDWFLWFRELPVAQGLYWCCAVGGYVLRSLIQLHEQERNAAQLALEKSQLESSLRQAQLEALRARINPHFLFNSLQNISVLVQQDPDTASRMLTRLGDLLRAALRGDSQLDAPLQREIELTEAYVAMEKMRFGDRLTVHFEVAPEVCGALVPCFLLQPLVENAIVHGLRGANRRGSIVIRCEKAGGDLALSVSDNGAGPPEGELAEMKVGFGLGSTSERLRRMYPNHHTLSMHRIPQGGTEVRITLPLAWREAAASAANHGTSGNGTPVHEHTEAAYR